MHEFKIANVKYVTSRSQIVENIESKVSFLARETRTKKNGDKISMPDVSV